MTTTTTTDAGLMPSLPCGPYLQALLVRAAEQLEMGLIPDWDDSGKRTLHRLRTGAERPYWRQARSRRNLSRTDLMACSALWNLAAETDCHQQRADALLMADEISGGAIALW